MISEQEKIDVVIFTDSIGGIKIRAYDLMLIFINMSEEELKHTGHKTKQDALLYTMQDTQKRIIKLTKEFIQKYPDK